MDRDNCKLFTSDEVKRPQRCLRGGQDSTLPESSARREIFASVLLPILDNRSMRRFAQFELIAHLLQACSKGFNLLLLVRDLRLEVLPLFRSGYLKVLMLLRDHRLLLFLRGL